MPLKISSAVEINIDTGPKGGVNRKEERLILHRAYNIETKQMLGADIGNVYACLAESQSLKGGRNHELPDTTSSY